MANLADEIERWILKKFSGSHGDMVILRRNELADELECAPSQISYVLSTRFSLSRGFHVESRRGLGGFIRIARIPAEQFIFTDVASRIDETTTFEELEMIIAHIADHGLLTEREGGLVTEACDLFFRYLDPQERVGAIQQLLIKIGTI